MNQDDLPFFFILAVIETQDKMNDETGNDDTGPKEAIAAQFSWQPAAS